MSDEYNNENAPVSETYPKGCAEAPVAPVAPRQEESQPHNSGAKASPAPAATAPVAFPCAPACGNYVNPAKKSRKWIVLLVVVAMICLTVMFSVTMCCAAVSSVVSPVSSEVGARNPSVAVINLNDSIDYNGTSCSPEGFKILLDEAASDSGIVAVVLRVNSGGGVATAGEEMAEYLRLFKETSGKPVVVSSASTNASAAYEISSQADYIFTAKSTAIGAIGTAMQLTDYSGLLDMLGIKVTNITSAESKDSTYGTRELTDDEIAAYQHQIDQINQSFVETVAQGRHMTVAQVSALATGLTYTGIDAVENGLADEIGTLDDAMNLAADLAGVGSYYAYELSISSSDLSSVFGTLLGANSYSTKSTGNLIKEYLDVKSVQ